jgi:hypothetical protein
LSLEKFVFVRNVNSVLDATYNLAYAGLRYGNKKIYLDDINLSKSLFLGVLDLETLNEYQNVKQFGKDFFESGGTDGFKEMVLALKGYRAFLKDKLFEFYREKHGI